MKGIKNILLICLGVLLVMLIAVAGYFIYQSMQLQTQVKELSQAQADTEMQLRSLTDEQAALNLSYGVTKRQLEAEKQNATAAANKIAILQSDLFDKEQQLNKTRVSLEEQQAKVAAISTDLFSLETNINASMAWFKVNAQLPTANIHLLDIFKTRMISDCVDGSELNLACISYLMANTAFNIHYRTDPQSTGKADFLQSVEQTIESQWGDCEDYSLLFKAELNYARQAQHGLSIVTFAGGGNGDFRVYPKESIPLSGSDSYWYVPNAHKIQLGSLDSINAYVICFRADSQNGHCTVALSQNRIENSGQIQLLAGAQVFESQTGQYLGTVGNEYTVCSSNDCLYQARAIMLVISDSDLYKFENGEWTSYSDYLARVNAARQELSAPNGA